MTSENRLEPFAQHRVPVEPLLRAVVEQSMRDRGFDADLDACGFQIYPSPSDEIDCLNPWFFVVAMNGGGSAYGLYLHPDAIQNGVPPWVYWEHEDDGIYWLADDSDTFFRGLLQSFEEDEPTQIERIHGG